MLTPNSRSYGTALFAVLLFLLSLIPDSPTLGSQPPAITQEAIVKAWKDRESRIRSFKFKCTQRRTIGEGEILSPSMGSRKNPQGVLLPSEPTTYDVAFSLTMDGMRMRYDRDMIGVKDNSIVRDHSISVNDGESVKTYCPEGRSRYPRGFIGNEKINPEDAKDLNLFPLLITYRPFLTEPGMGHLKPENLLKKFEILPARAIIQGRSCLCLQEMIPDARFAQREFWLDTERDFLIMRYLVRVGSKIGHHLDLLEYEKVGSEWVPLSWKDTLLNDDGSMRQSFTSIVQEHTVNQAIDEKEFQLDFPVGTLVQDRRPPASPGHPVRYIVREGGEKRLITSEELEEATYEQMVVSESGMALVQNSRPRLRWIFGSLVLLVLALGVWRVGRFIMRRRVPT